MIVNGKYLFESVDESRDREVHVLLSTGIVTFTLRGLSIIDYQNFSSSLMEVLYKDYAIRILCGHDEYIKHVPLSIDEYLADILSEAIKKNSRDLLSFRFHPNDFRLYKEKR